MANVKDFPPIFCQAAEFLPGGAHSCKIFTGVLWCIIIFVSFSTDSTYTYLKYLHMNVPSCLVMVIRDFLEGKMTDVHNISLLSGLASLITPLVARPLAASRGQIWVSIHFLGCGQPSESGPKIWSGL